MAMIECPHPQLCGGTKRHHNDSNTRAACEARGNAARAGAGVSVPKLSGLAAFVESQKPEGLTKVALRETFGTDDIEILDAVGERIEETKGVSFSSRRTGKHTATLADSLGDPAIKIDFYTTQKNPVKLADLEGNPLSVADAAAALDGGDGHITGSLDSATGSSSFGDDFGRLIADDGSVYFRRGDRDWATKTDTNTFSLYELEKLHKGLLPDTGEDYEKVRLDISAKVVQSAGSLGLDYFESKNLSHIDRMRSIKLMDEIKEMDERTLRGRTQGAIYAAASANRFRFESPREELECSIALKECQRRDKADHAEGCPAIGNRYNRALNDAAYGTGVGYPVQECTCK